MTNDELFSQLLDKISSFDYIHADQIPNIDLYMDQVTTFMDDHLKNTKRYPEDKVLTKTMINNYAKNNLLPAPNKKKYSREHILLLIFIYYFKNILSINDIEELFRPITAGHFALKDGLLLEDIYKEIFALEAEEMKHLREDVKAKYERAGGTFTDENLAEEDREYLRLFALICELSFDVYLKKQMVEQMIDELREANPSKKKK